jgi:hypothetical protein
MNKIIIALGLTLAAATGAFAASPNDYVELNAPKAGLSGVDYTATASFNSGPKAQIAPAFEDRSLLYNR